MYPPTTINLLMEQFHDAGRYFDDAIDACVDGEWVEAAKLLLLASDSMREVRGVFSNTDVGYETRISLADNFVEMCGLLYCYVNELRDNLQAKVFSIMGGTIDSARRMYADLLDLLKEKQSE